MKKIYLSGVLTLPTLSISCSSAKLQEISLTEDVKQELSALTLAEQIKKGDELWQKKGANFAIPAYEYALKNIKKSDSVYIPTIAMRITQAGVRAKDKQSVLNAIDTMEKLEYIPEHQKLRSKELKEILEGKDDPGLDKTPNPPLAPDTIYKNRKLQQIVKFSHNGV